MCRPRDLRKATSTRCIGGAVEARHGTAVLATPSLVTQASSGLKRIASHKDPQPPAIITERVRATPQDNT